jgi:hypothetical protein
LSGCNAGSSDTKKSASRVPLSSFIIGLQFGFPRTRIWDRGHPARQTALKRDTTLPRTLPQNRSRVKGILASGIDGEMVGLKWL